MKKILLAFLLFSNLALAADPVPACLTAGQNLPVNNDQILLWKTTTKNQFLSRGHVDGTLGRTFPDHSGHHHLEVQIGKDATDTIEVIYNEAFGPIPELRAGMHIEACGDYITSIAQSGPYPASPDGAILHWVHKAPSGAHESGYLVVDGTVCGQNVESAPPKPPHSGNNGGHHHSGHHGNGDDNSSVGDIGDASGDNSDGHND